MAEFPDDPASFQQAWSQLAGRVSATKQIMARLEERAANCFINRNDKAAEELREFAYVLKREVEFYSKELNGFITEAHKRDHEIRQQQPGHPGKFTQNEAIHGSSGI